MTKIYVFPGQGSQSVGMGAGLFDQFPEQVEIANDILGYSIKDLCINDSNQQLNNTDYTQPALFVVSALSYLSKLDETGSEPDFVAGHSLGEYSALFAAKVFDFSTGLNLVQKRGEIMSKVEGGGMAAIIGMDSDKIKNLLESTAFDTIDVANYNSPGQTVISGLKKDIMDVQQIFEDAGVRMYVPLKVSGAFHSRYMKEAQTEFEDVLANASFNEASIPCIANYTAQAYTLENTRNNLAQQISNSVRWVESILLLKNETDPEFQEIGPGKILTRLVAQIK